MRRLDVQGDPVVVVENDTHVLCVRPFPSNREQPEYVVWRKDLDGSVSSGSYFPVFTTQVEAFADALSCFDARSKSDLRRESKLKEAQRSAETAHQQLNELLAKLRL